MAVVAAMTEYHQPRRNQDRRTRSNGSRLLALLACAALILAACSSTDAPVETSGADADMTGPVPNVSSLLNAMLTPEDEHAVRAALDVLPEPLRTSRRTVQGRHSAFAGEVLTLDYGVVLVTVYQPGGEAEPLLAGIEVTVPGHTFEGLSVGMSERALRDLLGPAAASTHEEAVYRLSPARAAPHELIATSEDGIVTRLRWAAYLD